MTTQFPQGLPNYPTGAASQQAQAIPGAPPQQYQPQAAPQQYQPQAAPQQYPPQAAPQAAPQYPPQAAPQYPPQAAPQSAGISEDAIFNAEDQTQRFPLVSAGTHIFEIRMSRRTEYKGVLVVELITIESETIDPGEVRAWIQGVSATNPKASGMQAKALKNFMLAALGVRNFGELLAAGWTEEVIKTQLHLIQYPGNNPSPIVGRRVRCEALPAFKEGVPLCDKQGNQFINCNWSPGPPAEA